MKYKPNVRYNSTSYFDFFPLELVKEINEWCINNLPSDEFYLLEDVGYIEIKNKKSLSWFMLKWS